MKWLCVEFGFVGVMALADLKASSQTSKYLEQRFRESRRRRLIWWTYVREVHYFVLVLLESLLLYFSALFVLYIFMYRYSLRTLVNVIKLCFIYFYRSLNPMSNTAIASTYSQCQAIYEFIASLYRHLVRSTIWKSLLIIHVLDYLWR